MSLLQALIAPATVALVGASDNPARLTARPLRFLQANGFAGRICPVNPARATVQGLPAWPSVSAIPGGVDHACLLVPTDAVLPALLDCAEAGVRVVSVLADGFAESGPEGLARQTELTAVARAAGMLLLGPNSMGVVNTANGFICTTNAAFGAGGIATGRTAVLSQSGSILGTLLSRGAQRGVAFSRLVSLGNEALCGAGRIGLELLDDPGTDSFALFLETIRDADELAEFGRRAAAAGKPVVAYVLGRSDEGKALAASHTGALTGSQAAVAAFLDGNGIRRAELLDSFLDAPGTLSRLGPDPQRPRRVTVVSTTGGGGALVLDQLSLRGAEIDGCPPAVRQELAAAGITIGHGKLLDVTLAGTRYETMKAVVAALIRAPETGLLVVAPGSSARFNPELAVKPVIDAVAEAPVGAAPVAMVPLPHAPESLALARAAGIPAFASPEAAAEVIALALRAPVAPVARPQRPLSPAVIAAIDAAAADGPLLDEVVSGGIARALGVPMPPQVVLAPGQAPDALAGLRFPLVAKVVSPDLPHKTEAGAVALGLGDAAALAAAIPVIRASARRWRPDLRERGVLVQQMCSAHGEALIGLTRDPLVGPVLTLGAGGVLAEVYADVQVHPAPVTLAEARAMIARIRGFAPLRGYRGAVRGDLEALAELAAGFSHLLADPRIAEAELNPVLIGAEGTGVTAVDALIRLQGQATPPDGAADISGDS